MRKISALLLISILWSCAPNAQLANSQLEEASKLELSAWKSSAKRVTAECANGRSLDEIERSEAVKLAKCATRIAKASVLPVAAFPDLLIKLRATSEKNAEAFAAGKISNSEWKRRGDESWAEYSAAWNARAREYWSHAYQADIALGQRMSSAGLALQQQARAEELDQARIDYYKAQAQAARSSTLPTTTECRQSGLAKNSVTCETR